MIKHRPAIALFVALLLLIRLFRQETTYAYPQEYLVGHVINSQYTVVSPDPFEPDNTCLQANAIGINSSPQHHNFHISTDVDWVKFHARAGQTYVLETGNLGPRADTVMQLFAADCTTLLAYDDDSGIGLGSRIRWTPSIDSVYYILISPFSSFNAGSNSDYTLSITTQGGGGTCYRTLAGIVYHDANMDKTKSPSERGIGGIVIRLIGPVRRAIVSRDNGTFGFAGFPPGKYRLLAEVPNGMTSTSSNPINITVDNDRCWYKADNDFGIVETPGALFPFTRTPPKIDGKIDKQWNNTHEYEIEKTIIGNEPSHKDIYATFRGLWDNDNLYLLVKVNDDYIVSDYDPNIWNDDSVEIYLDIDDDKGPEYDANDYQYIFRLRDSSVYETHHNNTDGVRFTLRENNKGYILEARFPWSTLRDPRFPFQEIYLIGIDVQVNDDDDGAYRDNKISWWSHKDKAWQDSSIFGTAKLVFRADNIPTITTSAYFPAMMKGPKKSPISTPTPTPTPIFIPTPTPTPTPFFCDAFEPNDNRTYNPWGPLISGHTYYAKLCLADEDNYFFDTKSTTPITLYLRLPQSLVGHVAIWLYSENKIHSPICGTGPVSNYEYRTTCTIPYPGRYIVRIYADYVGDPNNPYALRVTYR